jgi:hypothetical protein
VHQCTRKWGVGFALTSTMIPPAAALWVLIAFIVLSGVVLWALFRSWHKKALPHFPVNDGAGSRPILELVGGARILSNYSMPFGRLRLWERGISLSAPGVSASLTWSEISRAALIKPALAPIGFGVEFRTSGYLPLVYWGRKKSCLQVLDICEQHRVQVEREARMRV